MTNQRRFRWVLALLLSVSLFAAACGDDGDDSSAPSDADTGSDDGSDAGDDGDSDAGDSDAGDSDSDGDDATDGDGPAADTTAILRFGQMRADSLDPVREAVPCESTVLYTIFDTLVTLDAAGQPQPMLAESWEIIDDTILRLHLRDDVLFHDGTEMDAASVVFSLERVLNDPDSNISSQLDSVASVTEVDEVTVDLELSAPTFAATLANLGRRPGMIMSPTAFEAAGNSEAFSRAPVGTGPYRIEGDWSPRESASVRAAENYWDPSAQNLAGIDFTEFTQDQLNALRAGDMDVVALKPLDILSIEGDDSYKVTPGPSLTFRIFVMNETLEPFDDPLVRQAVAHAIDREAIADIQLQGLGGPAYQFVPEGSLAYDESLNELYPYDPDRARELLAEAGYADGLSIESAIGSSATSYVQTGELVQAQLAEVGIDMDLQLVDSATMVPALFSDGPDGTGALPSAPFGGGATQDPDFGFRNIFTAGGAFNAGENEPPGLVELLDEGAASLDPEERAEAYQEANRIGVEGVYHGVPLWFEVTATATQPYVGGVDQAISECVATQSFFRNVYISEGREAVSD